MLSVNQYYYKRVLEKLREKVRIKRPQLWKNKFILHHDDAPAHTAPSVKKLLAEKQIPALDHPPYLPDLAPCGFCLFSKVKSVPKRTRFASVEEAKNDGATTTPCGKKAFTLL